jgi:hypothetical protein
MKVDITEKTVQQVKAVLDNRAWEADSFPIYQGSFGSRMG